MAMVRKTEYAEEDFGKLIRMVITLPFSPEFFFYSYIVFPTFGKGNPWAWQNLPSSFDSEPIDVTKRIEVMERRRSQALVSAILSLKGETVEVGDEKKIEARNKQLSFIQKAFKSSDMGAAITELKPLLITENEKKESILKMKLQDVPGSIVKDCLRSVGIEGLPNWWLINRLNNGELSKYFDKT